MTKSKQVLKKSGNKTILGLLGNELRLKEGIRKGLKNYDGLNIKDEQDKSKAKMKQDSNGEILEFNGVRKRMKYEQDGTKIMNIVQNGDRTEQN